MSDPVPTELADVYERQTRAAERAAEHASLQAEAAQDAVKEARRALRVAILSLVVAWFTAAATVVAPIVAQWAADRSKSEDRLAVIAASIADLEGLLVDAHKLDCLTCVGGNIPDRGIENEVLHTTLESYELRPLAIARLRLADAMIERSVVVAKASNKQAYAAISGLSKLQNRTPNNPDKNPLGPALGRLGAGRSFLAVPYVVYLDPERLHSEEIAAAQTINEISVKWHIKERLCLSEKGYPFDLYAADLIRVDCKNIKMLRPINGELESSNVISRF